MLKYLDDNGEVREIVEDGESIRCPAYLMDATQLATVHKFASFAVDPDHHRPHYARVSDQERERRATMRAQYLADLQAAWKLPAHGANQNIQEPGHLKITRSNVARAAATDEDPSARASAVEKQLERWQGRDLSELARDVEARRRATHAEFAERLSNAWRGGK
jgi:hypothetical protein